jgi:hypothetical protein
VDVYICTQGPPCCLRPSYRPRPPQHLGPAQLNYTNVRSYEHANSNRLARARILIVPPGGYSGCRISAKRLILSDSLRACEYKLSGAYQIHCGPEHVQYALTRSSAHPSGKYAALQSADNQMMVYAAGDKNRKKRIQKAQHEWVYD